MKKLRTLSSPFKYNEKFVEKSDYRVYREAVIITPGVWTDSVSQQPIKYTKDKLRQYSSNWISNHLDIDHSWKVLDLIGSIQNMMYFNDAIVGDLYINPNTTRKRDVITQIDSGEVNFLSVELMAEDIWNEEEQLIYADEIDFMGAAIVTHPACKDTKIR